MANLQSLERSEKLHRIGQDFLIKKPDIPLGTNEKYLNSYAQLKSKILDYFNATESQWEDWNWQLNNRIDNFEQLKAIISLTNDEIEDIKQISEQYRFAISPYYLALTYDDSSNDVIKLLSIPSVSELDSTGETDPMSEEFTNPVAAVTRRYPDRLIINVTNTCSSYCRHCQRRRKIGSLDSDTPWEQIQEALKYIEENTEIRDVLVTGGDALSLKDEELEKIISSLRNIKHVEIIRIGTRMLVTLPQRITTDLVDMLSKYHPIYMNTQFNHPREITPETSRACQMLADRGILLGNQMVLLKGINDDKYIVRLLNQELLRIRVKPYYIFHAKNIKGTTHFQTSIEKGLSIMKYLRGNTSGLAIPTYIVNAPRGLGKIPILSNQIISNIDGEITLETWEGEHIKVELPMED